MTCEQNAAAEAEKILEGVRLALRDDLAAATRNATRLAVFLTSRVQITLQAGRTRGGLAPWQQRKVIGHIEDNLGAPVLVRDLARLVSLSPSHFCRAFRESFGDLPHAYIMRMKLDRARELMLTTSEPLSRIALACGLADQAHLTRLFRRSMGETPSAWRRRTL